MEHTLADHFTRLIPPFAYEGIRSEKSIADFVDPDHTWNESKVYGAGEIVLVVVVFSDQSFAMLTPGRNNFLTGMVGDGQLET